ncbi:MAG: lipid-A-disaccharide synthase [Calditrichaeota bacterium]|nr:lipid-A-disaccharide synthase [Calditrichota bacterium]MCB0268853.1 lipid-A-disaccharide synthase [Calditrichota bacterium]
MTKILIIAGEASGDKHAADLILELQRSHPEIEFTGIGGDDMQRTGAHLIYHIRQLAVLGITEIIKHLPFIRQVQRDIVSEMKKGVDATILVDYPGFNLRIAKLAHEAGIPVIYYISPQLWAWGEKRVEKVRKYIDLLLVLFRFEVDFYANHGINAEFVGHPLVDQVQISQSETDFRNQNAIEPGQQILGLFPGSREMEVRKLLPVMVAVASKIRDQFGAIPVIGKASQLPDELYHEVIKSNDIKIVEGKSHQLMRYSYATMVASGTATLEMGFLQTPMVVLYEVSPITYWLGRFLVKIDKIALANIVAGEKVVPEFIQKEITTDAVSAAIARYFTDQKYYDDVKSRLSIIKDALGEPGASLRAAKQISMFLKKDLNK